MRTRNVFVFFPFLFFDDDSKKFSRCDFVQSGIIKSPNEVFTDSTYDTNIPKVKEEREKVQKKNLEEKRNKNKKSFFLSQIFLGFLIFFFD